MEKDCKMLCGCCPDYMPNEYTGDMICFRTVRDCEQAGFDFISEGLDALRDTL